MGDNTSSKTAISQRDMAFRWSLAIGPILFVAIIVQTLTMVFEEIQPKPVDGDEPLKAAYLWVGLIICLSRLGQRWLLSVHAADEGDDSRVSSKKGFVDRWRKPGFVTWLSQYRITVSRISTSHMQFTISSLYLFGAISIVTFARNLARRGSTFGAAGAVYS